MDAICEALRKAKKPIILAHHNADMDSICSALALHEMYKEFGIDSKVAAAQGVSKRCHQVTREYSILSTAKLSQYDAVIIVDTSSKEQLAPIELEHGNIILIDHHSPNNLESSAKVSLIDPNAPSVSEMVYEIIVKLKAEVTPKIAELIACGVLAETSYFRYAKRGTFELFLKLLDKVDYEKIQKLISSPIDQSERIARLRAAGRARVYRAGDFIVAISEVGSFEASACRGLMSLGADIAVVSCIKENEIRISSRGNGEIGKKLDLAKDVFSQLGEIIGGSGGGHPLAGSANGSKTESLFEANKKILELIAKKLGTIKEIT